MSTFGARILLMLLLSLVVASAEAAETVLAKPEPTPDSPRRILLQLATDDERAVNDVLYNVVNVQKFYGQDNVRVLVASFGAGNRALYKDTSPVKARIESLLQYDVEFVACGNTMEVTNRTKSDLIEGVEVVTAGVPEIAERQLNGWVYIRP